MNRFYSRQLPNTLSANEERATSYDAAFARLVERINEEFKGDTVEFYSQVLPENKRSEEPEDYLFTCLTKAK